MEVADREINHDNDSDIDTPAPDPRPNVWKVSAEEVDLKEHRDLWVMFRRPYISRTGLIMPNRLVAEFAENQQEEARVLFYELLVRKVPATKNWLDFNKGRK